MKSSTINKYTFFAFIATCLVLTFLLDARGGRGGGGGGGGGGSRGGGRGASRSVQRSPSMSRVSSPKPTANRYPSSSRITQTPRSTPSKNQVQNFLNDRPKGSLQTPQRQLSRNANVPAQRHNFGQNVRNDLATNRPLSKNLFRDNFWDRRDFHPAYWNARQNWWQAATAVGVASWLGWDADPVYYDYSDEDWGSSGDSGSYSDTSQSIASSSEQGSSSNEWMPLGVFALSKEGNSTATPTRFLQLAISKNGAISGAFYNSITDTAHEIEGMADKNSQRAAWKITDNDNSPIMTTGIYNLTQNEIPVKLHFQNGQSQEMLLVRAEVEQ